MEYEQQTSEILYEEPHGMHGMLPFLEDSLHRVSVTYIVWLLVALCISFMVYYLSRGLELAALRPAQFVYYTVLLGHIIYRFKNGGLRNAMAPDIIFIMFYTLFHLGYVTLYSLNILPFAPNIFYYTASAPRAMFVINLGLIGFLVGYELLGSRGGRQMQPGDVIIPKNSWCTLGIVLMTIAIVMHIAGLFFLGATLLSRYGYGAIQNAPRYISYWPALALGKSRHLMALGLAIYLISSSLRYGTLFHSKLALGLTIAFFSIVILEGERGSILTFGMPILMVRHYFIKPIRIRYLAILLIAALTLFSALAVVRTIVFKPAKMWQEYKYKKTALQLGWYSPFVEMGRSFVVVGITTNDVPSQEPYWKGASWGNAAVHIVPFLQGFTYRLGLTSWGPSEWITTTYFGHEAAGRAFTVAAEGYLNFGLPGAFIQLMLFGLFIRWLTVKFSKKPSAMWAFIMLGCLGPSIMVIRGHVNLVTNRCAQVIVLALLLNLFLRNETIEEAELEEAGM